jgi:hypothetical protein
MCCRCKLELTEACVVGQYNMEYIFFSFHVSIVYNGITPVGFLIKRRIDADVHQEHTAAI